MSNKIITCAGCLPLQQPREAGPEARALFGIPLELPPGLSLPARVDATSERAQTCCMSDRAASLLPPFCNGGSHEPSSAPAPQKATQPLEGCRSLADPPPGEKHLAHCAAAGGDSGAFELEAAHTQPVEIIDGLRPHSKHLSYPPAASSAADHPEEDSKAAAALGVHAQAGEGSCDAPFSPQLVEECTSRSFPHAPHWAAPTGAIESSSAYYR
jgi:hypothetical protein